MEEPNQRNGSADRPPARPPTSPARIIPPQPLEYPDPSGHVISPTSLTPASIEQIGQVDGEPLLLAFHLNQFAFSLIVEFHVGTTPNRGSLSARRLYSDTGWN